MQRHVIHLLLAAAVYMPIAHGQRSFTTHVPPLPSLPNVATTVPQAQAPAFDVRTHRGDIPTHGSTESFVATGRCLVGSDTAEGFTRSSGLNCSVPGFFNGRHGGFQLERTLTYNAINPESQLTKHFGLTFSEGFGTGVAYVGLSTCVTSTSDCAAGTKNEVGLTVNSTGLYLLSSGASTLIWSANRTIEAQRGTTDSSSQGREYSWAAPQIGKPYTFTLMVPGDGTAIISVTPTQGEVTYETTPISIRIPITLPKGPFRRFFVRGDSADYVTDVTLGNGYTFSGSPVYDIVTSPFAHGSRLLRWAIHASDGTECNYSAITSDCQDVFALIPPSYKPNGVNPWLLQIRGQELSFVSYFSTFAPLNAMFLHDGLIQIWGSWSDKSLYGGPYELGVVAGAVNVLRSRLALTDRPQVEADSAGGIVVANLITHSVLLPKIFACYSCNFSLATDADGNGGEQKQISYIEDDYGFEDAEQYRNITAGYDPLLVLQNPLDAQGPFFGPAYPLSVNAAALLASVPTYLSADDADIAVNTNLNSVAYCSALNSIHSRICTLNLIQGSSHVTGTMSPTNALRLTGSLP